jgi:hypothetical protein
MPPRVGWIYEILLRPLPRASPRLPIWPAGVPSFSNQSEHSVQVRLGSSVSPNITGESVKVVSIKPIGLIACIRTEPLQPCQAASVSDEVQG